MGLIDSLNGAEGGAPVPQDNARAAFDYYVSQGLTPVQAAGIVGNLQGESGQGLNPNAVNRGDGRDGSDSIGIGQWNSTRAQSLKEFAAAKGVPWNDLNTQLEFLHTELKGPESKAYSRLTAAQTPEEAGRAMLAYERPKDWDKPGAHPERGQYATSVFARYGTPGASAGPAAPAVAAPVQPANRVASAIMGTPQAPPAPDIASQIMGQPQAAQQQQFGGQSTFASDVQPVQSSPIQFAQRRAPDLSKLRAMFKAPATFRG